MTSYTKHRQLASLVRELAGVADDDAGRPMRIPRRRRSQAATLMEQSNAWLQQAAGALLRGIALQRQARGGDR